MGFDRQEVKGLYLIGDIRYSEAADVLYENEEKAPTEFLLGLQGLMEKYGVVKVDVSIDAFKFANCKHLL